MDNVLHMNIVLNWLCVTSIDVHHFGSEVENVFQRGYRTYSIPASIFLRNCIFSWVHMVAAQTQEIMSEIWTNSS